MSSTRTRTRTCTNPAPLYRGETCQGQEKEEKDCPVQACPGRFELVTTTARFIFTSSSGLG